MSSYRTHCQIFTSDSFDILRRFKHLDPGVLVHLFKVTVLEYCCPVWSPSQKLLVNEIEAVQRRFTKLIRGSNNLSYQDRLESLELCTLEARRKQLDIVLAHMIVHNQSCLPFELMFIPVSEISLSLRGHDKRLSLPVHEHRRTPSSGAREL
jgi:hypothetical protein